jgi:hypothetical protein
VVENKQLYCRATGNLQSSNMAAKDFLIVLSHSGVEPAWAAGIGSLDIKEPDGVPVPYGRVFGLQLSAKAIFSDADGRAASYS